jgi:glycosyltransferase involved in cell wall biosynthesis
MKMALLSTYENGGAGKAALRLHKGLSLIGEDSTFFVKHKSGFDKNVIRLHGPEINNLLFENIVQKHFIQNIYPGNSMSSMMYPSVGFNFLKCIEEYDIINVHWVSMFISLEAIVKMNAMGKPIIWTLHDQNPMTGACHYTHGCEKYKTDCSDCPQLKEEFHDIAKTVLETKKNYLPKELVIVTPSQWLADCAKESTIFKDHRIEVISNSLETDIFYPVNKEEAKRIWGIPANAKVILFGACDHTEHRKGFLELIEAIKNLVQTDENIKKLLCEEKLYIFTFGYNSSLLTNIGVPLRALGYIDSDRELCLAYSAADVYALPSLEDNLPNTLLESLACGTPVVAFSTGGMTDVIENGKNGFLSAMKDTKSFGERLAEVLKGDSMNEECRRYALEHFQLEIQASEYQSLFQEVCKEKKVNPSHVNIPAVFPEMSQVFMPFICDTAIDMEVQNRLDKTESDLNREYQINRCYESWLEKILINKNSASHALIGLAIKSVAIFGTRKIAEYLLADLTRSGIKVECFLDNNPEVQNTKLMGVYVFSLEWLKQNYDTVDAIILSIKGEHDEEVKKQILQMLNYEKPVLSWKDLVSIP